MNIPSTLAIDVNKNFAQLLDWHLSRGTRPKGTPKFLGKPWTDKELAGATGVTQKTVNNWRNGRTLPDIAPIERELFGDNPAYSAWQEELRTAHHAARVQRSVLTQKTASITALAASRPAEPDEARPQCLPNDANAAPPAAPQAAEPGHRWLGRAGDYRSYLALRALGRETFETMHDGHGRLIGIIIVPLGVASDLCTLAAPLAHVGLVISLLALLLSVTFTAVTKRFTRRSVLFCTCASVSIVAFGIIVGLQWVVGAGDVGVIAKKFPIIAELQQRTYDELHKLSERMETRLDDIQKTEKDNSNRLGRLQQSFDQFASNNRTEVAAIVQYQLGIELSDIKRGAAEGDIGLQEIQRELDAGDVETAIQSLRSRITDQTDKRAKDTAASYRALAALEVLRNPNAALADYEEALKHQPDNVESLVGIGAIKIGQGQLTQGEAAFRRAARNLQPGADPFIRFWMRFGLAASLMLKPDLLGALGAFQSAYDSISSLENDNDNNENWRIARAESQLAIGTVQSGLGRFSEALALLKKGVSEYKETRGPTKENGFILQTILVLQQLKI